jgi:hypothetical protein
MGNGTIDYGALNDEDTSSGNDNGTMGNTPTQGQDTAPQMATPDALPTTDSLPTVPDTTSLTTINDVPTPGPGNRQSAEQMAFQAANPNGGSFPNVNPIDASRFSGPNGPGQATPQGPSLGNGRPLTTEEQYFQDKYPNGGQFSAQGQPVSAASSLPNAGGGVPQGSQYMAAGPGWAVDAHGRSSSTNSPDFVRANQGFQGGFIGPGTIVETANPANHVTRYDAQQGIFREGGNFDPGYRTFGGAGVGKGEGFGGNFPAITDLSGLNLHEFGPQPLVGGAFGASKIDNMSLGDGINMGMGGSKSDRSPQQYFNEHMVGGAIPGGAAGAGNPDLNRMYAGGSLGGQPLTGGGSYGQGSPPTGILSPDGSFGPLGGNRPQSATGNAATAAASSNLPSAGGGAGTLTDSNRLVRDASGNVVGVSSANGYYNKDFQSVSNMLDNYQQGDRMKGTVEALEILSNAGLGQISDNARKVLGADQATQTNFTNSPLEQGWGQRHNAEASKNGFGNQQVQVNSTPNSLKDSFPMGQELAGGINKLGGSTSVGMAGGNMQQGRELMAKIDATGRGQVTMDNYGNIVFEGKDGQTRHIPENQWKDALAQVNAELGLAEQNQRNSGSSQSRGQSNGQSHGSGSNEKQPSQSSNELFNGMAGYGETTAYPGTAPELSFRGNVVQPSNNPSLATQGGRRPSGIPY